MSLICVYYCTCIRLQTASETVFGVGFWGLSTFSEGIWSTTDQGYSKIDFMSRMHVQVVCCLEYLHFYVVNLRYSGLVW